MNEFTKEELREIFWIIEGCTMDYIGKENNILINKIESIIVNYCDHEKVVPNYGPNTQCDKCGEIW